MSHSCETLCLNCDGCHYVAGKDPPNNTSARKVVEHGPPGGATLVATDAENAPVSVLEASRGVLMSTLGHVWDRPLVLDITEGEFEVKDKAMVFYGEPITDPHAGIDAALQKLRDKEYQRVASKPVRSEPTVVEFTPIREPPLATRIAHRFQVSRRRYTRWGK